MIDRSNARLVGLCRRVLAGAAVVAALLAPLGRTSVDAQAMATSYVGAAANTPANPTQGFTIPRADSQTIDKLDDFDRYADKQSWELAFRIIDTLAASDNRAMVPATEGFLFPIGLRIRQSLLHLPPAGRDAYRLFNDANAKQLWDHLHDSHGEIPADEVATLRKLVDHYFLTPSVGELAADRLGDALFEQGDFANAEALWQSIVRDYPDSRLAPAKLQLKRCIALARLGRQEQLAALAAQVRNEYRDQKVSIGGREKAAGDFAESLMATREPTAGASSAVPMPIVLPAAEQPAWQIRTISSSTLKQIELQMVSQGMESADFAATGPDAAVDERRIYVNWLGTIYAADLASGKMLWRTGKFSEMGNGQNVQNLLQLIQSGINPARFSVSVAGGKVLALHRDSANNDGNNPYRLECFDGATGQSLWNGSGWQLTVLAPPCVVGGVGYVLGIDQAGDALHLAAVNLGNGHFNWKIRLGKPQGIQNNQGGQELPAPHVLATGGMLYIATNNGALLGVSLAQRRVEWAFQHETRPLAPEGQMNWNGLAAGLFETPGTLVDAGGSVYLKDSAARVLYALDVHNPSLKWQRPIDSEDMIVGVAGQTAYLLGHELSALDLKTRQLLWSTRIPADTGSLRPIICPEHIYVSSSRGIYDIDPANGDIRRIFRGADRESGGGRLFVAGDKLICVTATAVTAYPLERVGAAR